MVDFIKKEAEQDVFIKKTNIHKEFFFRDYTSLVGAGDALATTKKIEIEMNKQKGYNALNANNLKEMLLIPGSDSMKNLIEKVQQGLGLFFMSELYEPLRKFDTVEMQNDFNERQKKAKVTDTELFDFFVDREMTIYRHFLDDWGFTQASNDRGQILKRDSGLKFIRTTDKSSGKRFFINFRVELRHFSINSLNFALDMILKQKENELKQSQIKKAN